VATNKSPPRPPRVIEVVDPRVQRRSYDDVGKVLHQDRSAQREGELLAQLSTEQQQRAELERRLAELERKAQQAQAHPQAQTQPFPHHPPPQPQPPHPHVAPTSPVRVDSMAPPRDGAFDFRGRFSVKEIGIVVAALTALGGSVATWFKTEQPKPQVIDNSSTIRDLQAQVTAQARTIATLWQHVQRSEDWIANAIEASCVDIVRTSGTRSLPDMSVSSTSNQKRKCPVVRLDEPQPVLGEQPKAPTP